MTVVDHAMTGGLLGLALHPLVRKYMSKPKAVFLIMLAALLPDIDYVTRLFGTGYYYNSVNNLYVSHRGFFHSVGGILFFAASALFFYFLFWWTWKRREDDPPTLFKVMVIAGLFLAGGVLHLFEDMLGPNGPWGGLFLFFPFSEAKYLGLNLYGWYDFFLIYLFTGAFFSAVMLYAIAHLSRIPSEKLDRIIQVLVAGTFIVATFHLWMSPGYPEELGFKNAEKVWKVYQLSILPEGLRYFSDQVQTTGMKTLFSTLPNIRTKHYVIVLTAVWGGLIFFLFVRTVVYLLYRKRLQARYRISPVRTLLLVVLIFVIFPPAGVGLYFHLNMPMSVKADAVPVASDFAYPVGGEKGFKKGWNGKNDKGWYVGQSFLEPFYHPGEDWNGMGGGNTDFGQPVYAVADGKVVFAENCFHWGNILMVQHRLPDGQIVFSLYAHLKDLQVKAGDVVRKRQPIGTIGRGYGDATYKAAHLHFEIRKGNMDGYPVTFWPRTLTYVPCSGVSPDNLSRWIEGHYVDPSDFIAAHRIPEGKTEKSKHKSHWATNAAHSNGKGASSVPTFDEKAAKDAANVAETPAPNAVHGQSPDRDAENPTAD
ncbi:MAG TPA: peptidoglycan DD-metalloendopeptidase family protein [Syntrophales bacterium]|nr:peptidoglycan DD-metalloendopeptidase family protein [Syntrophales bacterium]